MDHKPKNYAIQCNVYCSYAWFRKFLVAKHGLYVPKYMDEKLKADMTAVKVRGILKITSRRQLNTNKDAALRWKYLRLDAWAWRKHG